VNLYFQNPQKTTPPKICSTFSSIHPKKGQYKKQQIYDPLIKTNKKRINPEKNAIIFTISTEKKN
jgi:hypothetical protein